MTRDSTHAARGASAALLCFVIWGFFPFYWREMRAIDAFELIAQRITWSAAFVLLVMGWRRELGLVRAIFANPRRLGLALATGGLLTGNWLIYVWAVNNNHVIESGLGYFLVPIVNVAMGFLMLGEHLSPLQWAAVASAAAGALLLVVSAGGLPWISLGLAVTWGLYGFLRKRASMGPMDGLAVETLLFLPPALGFILWRAHTGGGALGHVDLRTHLFILGTGVVTAIPLTLYTYGLHRIRLATMGLLQYLTPSLHFLLGLLAFHEPFDASRFRAAILIWCGLALYSLDAFREQRRMAVATG